jgi:hypothetical protein
MQTTIAAAAVSIIPLWEGFVIVTIMPHLQWYCARLDGVSVIARSTKSSHRNE